MITITIWHNTAHDGEGRHIAMLDGYQGSDPAVEESDSVDPGAGPS